MFEWLRTIATMLDSKKMAAIALENENIRKYGASDLDEFDLDKPARQPTATEIRGLATGAILFFVGGNPIKLLPRIKPEPLVERKAATAEWWGISNAEEALDTLEWLREEGHRSKYQSQLKSQPMHWQSLFAANPFLKTRAVTNVAAWDYARQVNVARWCYDYDYLTWEEAWQYIDDATQAALHTYDSWDSFAAGFVAGRIMWAPDNDLHDHIAETARYLIEARYSPWRDIPWLTYPVVGN
ncbi:DUF1266 domain-containing protein [Hymenobacter volaticus]|uniref:DUF1266 domain-containing protein n=1 Tax=Hymenobacter volaticus TaxID=2932254 RepID=A0ABY4G2H0_9BACT|nr:DUF1266 domain-containing protein [Hymenobacter volaticus]UOQ65013.1 DUF1266 domain-containing protein [Hymenobacter volaticus]